MTRRLTIALVGIDGAGKTTQARWLADWLTAAGEPAGYWQNASGRRWFGRLAQRLGRRDGADLLGLTGVLIGETLLRWLSIARSLTVSRLRGQIAVMDRFAVCQYASIRARGGGGERLARVLFAGFGQPDLVIFLAVPPAEACRRVASRATDHEELADLVAADAAYRGLPEFARVVVVDATGTQLEVHDRIREAVAERLSVPGAPTDPTRALIAAPLLGQLLEGSTAATL